MKIITLTILLLFTGIVMSSEPANVAVLQTTNNEHIGFTLFHPNFEANSGDCVFVIVPKNAELFDSKEVSLLLDAKELGEHQWVRSGNEVIISFKGNEILKYFSNGTFIHIPSNTKLGVWFLAPVKK